MSKAKKKHIDIDFTLRRVFGKSSFRPVQREVILAALEGHDIFLQAATSFGKSLCFQLPAVIDHGSEMSLEMSYVSLLPSNV
jgi:superfamily II DNA helicase RecQ